MAQPTSTATLLQSQIPLKLRKNTRMVKLVRAQSRLEKHRPRRLSAVLTLLLKNVKPNVTRMINARLSSTLMTPQTHSVLLSNMKLRVMVKLERPSAIQLKLTPRLSTKIRRLVSARVKLVMLVRRQRMMP